MTLLEQNLNIFGHWDYPLPVTSHFCLVRQARAAGSRRKSSLMMCFHPSSTCSAASTNCFCNCRHQVDMPRTLSSSSFLKYGMASLTVCPSSSVVHGTPRIAVFSMSVIQSSTSFDSGHTVTSHVFQLCLLLAVVPFLLQIPSTVHVALLQCSSLKHRTLFVLLLQTTWARTRSTGARCAGLRSLHHEDTAGPRICTFCWRSDCCRTQQWTPKYLFGEPTSLRALS